VPERTPGPVVTESLVHWCLIDLHHILSGAELLARVDRGIALTA
jgi:hypothetical protein